MSEQSSASTSSLILAMCKHLWPNDDTGTQLSFDASGIAVSNWFIDSLVSDFISVNVSLSSGESMSLVTSLKYINIILN